MTVSVATYRLAAAAVVLALMAGCSTSGSVVQADYPVYASSAELIDKADLIVRGVALSSRPGKLLPDPAVGADPRSNPQAGLPTAAADAAREDAAVAVMITTVRLDEVLTGPGAAGDLIEVSRPAGEKGLPAAKSGYVLFLASYGPGEPHDLLNPDAFYAVADDGTLTAGGAGSPPPPTIDELRAAVR
jgi:hypothetical protein